MTALLILLAAALPQDSDKDKLRKFERSVKSDRDRKHSSDDRKKDRQEESSSSGDSSHFRQEDRNPRDRDYTALDFFLYPFCDHGRRFEPYPFAAEGPYYSTERFTDKIIATQVALTAGRIEHDLWSAGFEGVVSLSSGCDFRVDVLHFMEDVEGGTDRLTLSQLQFNIGLTPEPSPISFSMGLGFASLDGEETNESGLTFQGHLTWFLFKPVSFRLDGSIIRFEDAAVADVRAEIGFHLDRFAITAGVRSLSSDGGEDLTGPTLGFAVFF